MRSIYQRVYQPDMEATLAVLIQEIERLKRQEGTSASNSNDGEQKTRTRLRSKRRDGATRPDKKRDQKRAGETNMTQPALVTTPTQIPCVVYPVWYAANTEPMRQPRQMTEPDGVKDIIPKEILVGATKANPPKPVGEITAGTILAF